MADNDDKVAQTAKDKSDGAPTIKVTTGAKPAPLTDEKAEKVEVGKEKKVAEAEANTDKDDGSAMDGDLAKDDSVKAKIVENKGGEVIASAPTEEADVKTVTADEAMLATSQGRPIPGVDLKPGDRPDIQVTTREDVLKFHAALGDNISNGSVTKPGGDDVPHEELSHITTRTRRVKVDQGE